MFQSTPLLGPNQPFLHVPLCPHLLPSSGPGPSVAGRPQRQLPSLLPWGPQASCLPSTRAELSIFPQTAPPDSPLFTQTPGGTRGMALPFPTPPTLTVHAPPPPASGARALTPTHQPGPAPVLCAPGPTPAPIPCALGPCPRPGPRPPALWAPHSHPCHPSSCASAPTGTPLRSQTGPPACSGCRWCSVRRGEETVSRVLTPQGWAPTCSALLCPDAP